MAHLRCDIRSEVLDMGTSLTVFLPEHLDCSDVKVVYLLHGWADNCTGWSRYTSVERYARMYNVAVVIPEVQKSYYTDMEQGLNYYTYIHEELPAICKRMFGFTGKRENTYIMGLSMGGYGTLKNVFDTPERYCACASFSAVTDLAGEIERISEGRRNVYEGVFGKNLALTEKDDLMKQVEKADIPSLPRFYMSCGQQDVFVDQNRKFASILKEKGADILYEDWEGEHNWIFWDAAVKRAFDYFFGN